MKFMAPDIGKAQVSGSEIIHAYKTFQSFQEYKDKRIMIVDDEEFCIATMKSMLFSAGIDTDFHVDFCITGKEAVEQLIACSELGISYKVIFTDFSMPVMDGIEATTRMRAYLKNKGVTVEEQPTIIGVTGHTLEEFMNQGREAGMNEIIPKPMYIKTLKDKLLRYGAI